MQTELLINTCVTALISIIDLFICYAVIEKKYYLVTNVTRVTKFRYVTRVTTALKAECSVLIGHLTVKFE